MLVSWFVNIRLQMFVPVCVCVCVCVLLDCVCQQINVALKFSARVSVGKPSASIEAFLIFLCPSKQIAGHRLDYVITDSLKNFFTCNC